MQQITPLFDKLFISTNVEQLRKYGKAHIVYSPTKYKWVVSDKFKQ